MIKRIIGAVVAALLLAGCSGPTRAPTTPATSSVPSAAMSVLAQLSRTATSPDALVAAIEATGVECAVWSSRSEWERTCDSPRVWVFFDPLAKSKGPSNSLMNSTADLYETIFARDGGAAYRGDNWVIGADPAPAAILAPAVPK